MIFVIGTYKENGRIVALKLYNRETKELGMYHKRKVFKAIQTTGIQIAGIDSKSDPDNPGQKMLCMSNWSIYHTKSLDQLDSAGNPLDDKHVRVVISTKGFGETMQVTLVDSMGHEEVISYNEMIELMQQKKITGVHKNVDRIIFNKWCKHQGIAYNTQDIKMNEVLAPT